MTTASGLSSRVVVVHKCECKETSRYSHSQALFRDRLFRFTQSCTKHHDMPTCFNLVSEFGNYGPSLLKKEVHPLRIIF